MTYTLRTATAADAALVADISRQTFYDTFANDNKPEDMALFLDEQFTKGRLMLEVGRPEHHFVLAYDGPEVAGYVKLREGRTPATLGSTSALEIARLYACASYIGKGAGKVLMAESLRVAAERGKEWVWLGVWAQNQRAIDFYTAWGFEKFDECDFLLGTDVQRDWLMRRKV
ncbi:GNAT family N-acetyltransferase [Flaviaesturariibacter amylovorans]|uniref:GNAT family N-acetyltransferase n=1 Tax=Flaviaesturariibacter amylovorans TaxID=1084520 RepID=A0ABP8HUM7_9BACT